MLEKTFGEVVWEYSKAEMRWQDAKAFKHFEFDEKIGKVPK